MGVPVIAYAAAAVPSTLDGGGVLITDKNPASVAAIIHAVVTSQGLQDRILDSQDAALARLAAKDFAGTLLRFVAQVERAPRVTHPPIAFDFWEQLEQAKRLADIRAYRPAAFQALLTGAHQGGGDDRQGVDVRDAPESETETETETERREER
jgi:hypothetical protein